MEVVGPLWRRGRHSLSPSTSTRSQRPDLDGPVFGPRQERVLVVQDPEALDCRGVAVEVLQQDLLQVQAGGAVGLVVPSAHLVVPVRQPVASQVAAGTLLAQAGLFDQLAEVSLPKI